VVICGVCVKAHGAANPTAAAFKNPLRVETNIVRADPVYSGEASITSLLCPAL